MNFYSGVQESRFPSTSHHSNQASAPMPFADPKLPKQYSSNSFSTSAYPISIPYVNQSQDPPVFYPPYNSYENSQNDAESLKLPFVSGAQLKTENISPLSEYPPLNNSVLTSQSQYYTSDPQHVQENSHHHQHQHQHHQYQPQHQLQQPSLLSFPQNTQQFHTQTQTNSKFPDTAAYVLPSQSSYNSMSFTETPITAVKSQNSNHVYINSSPISVIRNSRSDPDLSSKRFKRDKQKRSKGIEKLKTQEDNDFMCEHCGKSFAKNYNLKSHLKTHSDEKPFSCSLCHRSFARNHDRKRHELLHQEIKRFQCGGILKDHVTRWGCGKKFSRADGLSRHFKTDIGWLCIRPLMLEAKKQEEGQGSSTEFDSPNLSINFINELIKKK